MKIKKVSFPVTEKEHENIKELASRERRAIKQLILDALDKLYPDWNKEEENKNSSK